MDYYQLVQAFPATGRWYLSGVFNGSGQEVDARVFRRGIGIDLSVPLRLPLVGNPAPCDIRLPLTIEVRREGPALDFTLGAFDLPVVRQSLADEIKDLVGGDVQRLATRVRGSDE